MKAAADQRRQGRQPADERQAPGQHRPVPAEQPVGQLPAGEVAGDAREQHEAGVEGLPAEFEPELVGNRVGSQVR